MKPANVMVTDLGGVKIMDFGVARVRGAEHVTMDGLVVGTPAYMAPEQVLAQEVDGRADLYSVGVVFYRLLTGTLPFTGGTPASILHRQVAELPAPLTQHRDDLPEWCEAIVQRALAKSPADRFQTAGEFRDALGRAAGMLTPTDLANGLAGADGQVPSPPARIPTLVMSPTEAGLYAEDRASGFRSSGYTQQETNTPLSAEVAVGAVARVRTGLAKAFRAKAGSILAAFAVCVAIIAYDALDKAETAPGRRTAGTSPAKAFPALVFKTKTLAGAASRQRERDARLVLAEGTITVTADDDTGDVLHAVANKSVSSISYSQSTHPLWNGPKGPTAVARAPGGALRALGVSIERHWVSLRTTGENRLVILRVDESQVRRLLSALEERTGCAPQVVASRKGAS
jgi:hypothetical protein